MDAVKTIDEANQALQPYVPLVSQLTGKGTTLDRIRPLMELLGNPQQRTRVVHIAGTSGKTSTAYFMAALLGQTGKQIGLTVSPHVDSVTERVQINGRPLNEGQFCAYLNEFLPYLKQLAKQPSYFELLYAFSFWVFAREGVDYAVVETGMGGLHDATNVVSRADKFCIITDIGFDHMHVLGNSIEEIAAQKAGIIQPHNQVLQFSQAPEINAVIDKQVAKQWATLCRTTQAPEQKSYGDGFNDGFPDYQKRNWLLAYRAYNLLRQRDVLPRLNGEQLLATQRVQVPGRMDVREIGGKTIIMDGAHNGQKMQTFLESFKQLYPKAKPAILLALKEGKEPADVIPLLTPLASQVIVTSFTTSQDLPTVSIPPYDLAQQFARAGVDNFRVIEDQHQALAALLAAPEKIGIITGSFYLLSQLRDDALLR